MAGHVPAIFVCSVVMAGLVPAIPSVSRVLDGIPAQGRDDAEGRAPAARNDYAF